MADEYGCSACGKRPKSIPYGSKRSKFWCSNCDRGHASAVNKKSERAKVKKEIKKASEGRERGK